MGDERFQTLVREHVGVLHRIARAFAVGADQHDLLQELLLALWRAAPSFRGDSAEKTFIFRVAHNRALSWRRSEARRRHRQSEYERLRVEEVTGEDPLIERLYAAIRSLESVDRSLMLLSLEGQSYAEIAALHGISETNVGARLTRARRKLTQLTESDNGL
ncbi:MAG: sigma-70 family RNA polymerase sigma factor [Hyphomonadaceae bacterium JAD_PAG50586_4]|nr:MAG: sigma-70 family RNA polymerase sigma factor [Hyphomonadaceae bacterium JAD_PAG50586_4]